MEQSQNILSFLTLLDADASENGKLGSENGRLGAGIGSGTQIFTLDGLIPVEFLTQGDRIVTRGGVRKRRGLRACNHVGQRIEISAGALGHDRAPEHKFGWRPRHGS